MAVVCEKIAEKSDVIEGKVEKKGIKRGLYGLGLYGDHRLGHLNYGTLGGYGVGSTISSSYPHYHEYPIYGHGYGYAGLPHLHGYASYPSYPTSIHTTITKHVPVAVPHPVPVTVEKHVPVPVAAPYPVEVPRPYPVEVPKPVPVTVERPYAVPVDRPYPVAIPHPVPVPIYKHVGIPVAQTYPLPVAKPLAIPYVSKEVYAHESWWTNANRQVRVKIFIQYNPPNLEE